MVDLKRQSWLFPDRSERFDDIDLAQLDPSDADDRSLLIRADHPELARAVNDGVDEVDVGGEQVNPRLHLLMHEVVANQILDDDSPEAWETVERLRRLGYDRHEILHMLASVTVSELGTLLSEDGAADPARLVAGLRALPDSWEAERDEDDEDDDDFDQRLDAAADALAERGTATVDELADQLGEDRDLVELVEDEASVVTLAAGRLAWLPTLLAATTFTHRLTAAEVDGGRLDLGTDLAVFSHLACDGDHLHLAGGETAILDQSIKDVGGAASESSLATDPLGVRAGAAHDEVLALDGPPGWLGSARAGDLVGLRRAGDPDDVAGDRLGHGVGGAAIYELVRLTEEPSAPDLLPGSLAASFARFGEGDGMPVAVPELLGQLAVDAPALVAGVLPPVSRLLEESGFEVRGRYTAPAGTDWERFALVGAATRAGARRGLDADEIHVLALVVLAGAAGPEVTPAGIDREALRLMAGALSAPAMAEAFADATTADPDRAGAFVSLLRSRAGARFEARLVWAESLVAGRAGNTERAEACLRMALGADADFAPAIEDLAWYAGDRGDARGAVALLERLDDDDDSRLEVLRRYADASGGGPRAKAPGRNDPCPCGSGRKYKQCCMGKPKTPRSVPLDERARWLWEKLRWWLDRAGYVEVMGPLAMLLCGRPPYEVDEDELLISMDTAASLVLFADGAVDDFLRQRGGLLPDDEANLLAQWALRDRSLFEVTGLRRGEGVDLRDLRTGDEVAVRERKGSALMEVGDVVYAHPVWAGTTHQFVGGLIPVPTFLRQPLMALLDEQVGSTELAATLGRARARPEMRNMDGDPMLLCEARYGVPDPGAAAGGLDRVLEQAEDHDGPAGGPAPTDAGATPAEAGTTWHQWVDVDGRRWMAGAVHLAGAVLTVSANSETRFERLVAAVNQVVPGLELLDESRESPDELLRRGQHQPTPDPAPLDNPEAAVALAAFMQEQERRWVDEPVPALAGLTPRQAAADPSRREDLVALLHEFDRQVAPPGAATFDTSRLRAMLDLDRG